MTPRANSCARCSMRRSHRRSRRCASRRTCRRRRAAAPLVIGAGKASAAMARAVEDHWPGPLSGLVVTRYGYDVAVRAHRDRRGGASGAGCRGPGRRARACSSWCAACGADDLVLCLISGGGSALLPVPLPGLTLADKQAVNRALLQSGATIGEMNCVRRHLSAIKGGRLAAACHPARVVTLLISRRAGRRSAGHRLGPDGGRSDDAAPTRWRILQRYGIDVPPSVLDVLRQRPRRIGQARRSASGRPASCA